ncbi:MAG TPA: hypothetical protein VFA02_04430 [Pseudacidobacterium sp.]|nr:hypothetical protein [Pseudacidobacterium sp.]
MKAGSLGNDSLSREAWIPSSAEDQALIYNMLEEILASAPFRSSRRYPAMLRYIVEKTLEGQQECLKERTIGVEVFGRDPGYDTNADPVVRFSAGEVRKRLAQLYHDTSKDYPVEVELPLGTYIPRFHRRAVSVLPGEGPALDSGLPANGPSPEPAVPYAGKRRMVWPVYLILALLIATGIGGIYAYKKLQTPDPVMAVWTPLLKISGPVLISAGRPHQDMEPPELPNISIKDHILRPEFRVSITTVSAIANIVGFLQAHQKPFRIHEAYSNTLADLHDRPVVLVNGNNNKWTLLLLRPLRFHFVQEGDFAYIEDAQHPAYRGWNVDFSKPYFGQTTDYAIVARFDSATTGGPVIVVAGISSNGTEAAGEFIVSPEKLAELEKSAPPGWASRNFEAVLKVEVVGGNTGAATVVASQFW